MSGPSRRCALLRVPPLRERRDDVRGHRSTPPAKELRNFAGSLIGSPRCGPPMWSRSRIKAVVACAGGSAAFDDLSCLQHPQNSGLILAPFVLTVRSPLSIWPPGQSGSFAGRGVGRAKPDAMRENEDGDGDQSARSGQGPPSGRDTRRARCS